MSSSTNSNPFLEPYSPPAAGKSTSTSSSKNAFSQQQQQPGQPFYTKYLRNSFSQMIIDDHTKAQSQSQSRTETSQSQASGVLLHVDAGAAAPSSEDIRNRNIAGSKTA